MKFLKPLEADSPSDGSPQGVFILQKYGFKPLIMEKLPKIDYDEANKSENAFWLDF